jgi:hydroxymethylglutaryl-CoA reductase (NADPH)
LTKDSSATIPMQNVGPILIRGNLLAGEFHVPLATYETPLWPSVKRGCAATNHAGGIDITLVHDCMTRSIILEAPTAAIAQTCNESIKAMQATLANKVTQTSRFAQLQDITIHPVANLLYIRFSLTTGDAAGHNMVTLAADEIEKTLRAHFPVLKYVSISGNLCTDKKNSAVNGLLGRGKYLIAECTLPHTLLKRILKTSAKAMENINIKKNLIGSIVSGGVRTANAHYANMLLAFYLATGQDAANIIEGSQGFTVAEAREEGLYFSTTLPNIIVGSVGNGKELPFVQNNLAQLGCLDEKQPGHNARKLAGIAAATVLCGELSLLAAQTNPGELIRSHIAIERKNKGVARAKTRD